MVGIICLHQALVRIELTELLNNSGWAKTHPAHHLTTSLILKECYSYLFNVSWDIGYATLEYMNVEIQKSLTNLDE